jgi:hypothetical protein
MIQGISNQISVRDAGNFSLTTYYKLIYPIDIFNSIKSFSTTPGLIDASGSL